MNKANQLCAYRELVLSVHAMRRSLSEFRTALDQPMNDLDLKTASGAADLQNLINQTLQVDPHVVGYDELEAFVKTL